MNNIWPTSPSCCYWSSWEVKYSRTDTVIGFFLKVAMQQIPSWRERGVMCCWVSERQPYLISVPFWGRTRNTCRPSVEEDLHTSCWISKRYSLVKHCQHITFLRQHQFKLNCFSILCNTIIIKQFKTEKKKRRMQGRWKMTWKKYDYRQIIVKWLGNM